MPFILLIVIGIIIAVTRSARKMPGSTRQNTSRSYKDTPNPWQNVPAARQAELKQKLEEAARKLSNAAEGLPARSTSAPADDAARRRQQEELKRRLKENAERRAAERARTYASSEGASMQQRKPLEKQELRRDTARSEKPIVASADDDCSGGSIHDGYHEGVTQFSPDRPAALAGKLGHRLADEDERLEREAASVANARRVMARISKLPPLSQGMVYSEILGKPRSETA